MDDFTFIHPHVQNLMTKEPCLGLEYYFKKLFLVFGRTFISFTVFKKVKYFRLSRFGAYYHAINREKFDTVTYC